MEEIVVKSKRPADELRFISEALGGPALHGPRLILFLPEILKGALLVRR